MTNAKKRFVAALVVFTSIVSFIPLPFGLNGTEANAAIDTSTATNVTVIGGIDDTNKSDIVGSENLYKTKAAHNELCIVMPKKYVSEDTLIKVGDSGIIKQKIEVLSVDGILNQGNVFKTDLDLDITDYEDDKYVGIKLTNLPLGVNKIQYKILLDTVTRIPNPDFEPESDKDVDKGILKRETITKECPTMTIEHGNEYVQTQINSIEFKNYIDGRQLTSTENKTPFRYDKTVKTTNDSSLRYVNSLPISVTDLDYSIKIAKGMFDINEDKIYVDGKVSEKDSINTKVEGNYTVITDSLKKTSQSTMVVLAVNRKDAIQRSFSIEIKYKDETANNDYTLRDIGITKYNYQTDKDVKAYIGKEFTETTGEGDLAGIPIYTNTITVDKLASMISMEPTIGRNSSITAYKLYSTYEGGTSPGQLKNGKIFVDFKKGLDSIINLEVYNGKEGSAIETKPLAIYKFKVNMIDEVESGTDVDFSFINAQLTQPGREPDTSEGAEAFPFTVLRRSYDLHSGNESVINFKLENPSTFSKVDPDSSASADSEFNSSKVEDGKIRIRREYVKAWLGNSVKSDNVKPTEVTAINKKNGQYSVDVGDAKKLVLQAYYDEVVYEIDAETGKTAYKEGKPVEVSRKSYPIGDKYTFYIAKNAGKPDEDDTSSNLGSSNAALKNIEIKDSVISAADGTNGFSKDKNIYTSTVPKETKEAKVTVTSEEKVKDISVKVVESGDEYGLESGEPFNFPLNSSGKTTLEIVVTAEDGSTTKLYTLTITNDSRSASTLLKNVYIDNGDLSFDPDKSVNKIRVELGVKKLSITPVPEDVNSKVTVNGTKFTGGPITISLSGSQETSVKIEVTAEDQSASKTYKLEIYRTDAVVDDGDDNSDSDIFYDEFNGCWVDTSKYEEWGKVNGRDVYFDKKGRQVKNAWIQTNNKWYYLNSYGYKATGWRTETAGKTYYLDPTTGELRTGWLNLNGNWYYLGLNGVMHRAWLSLNGKWYYFTDQGVMIANQSMYIDDKVYRFGADGAIY